VKLNVVYIILLLTISAQIQAQHPDSIIIAPSKSQKARKFIPKKYEVNVMGAESFSLGSSFAEFLGYAERRNRVYYNSTGRLSVSYLYRVKKWLGVGATSTYTPYGMSYIERTYNITKTEIQAERTEKKSYGHILSFAGEIRFYINQKPYMNMYAALALGYTIDFLSSDGINNNSPSVKHLPYYQITPFGISFGKNFIFGGEIGYGRKGIINAYIGYKFNAPKTAKD
jgi:hypothetical protein